ncbi:MAG: zinc ABC transporter substrate-binding protein [Bacteroidota bacterium]
MERLKFYLRLFLLVGYLGLVACGGGESPSKKEKFFILTTTGMIADITQNICGDRIEVKAMMGPGVDPHLYKATREDLTLLRKADMVLYNGLHLEGKMGEVLEKLGRQKPVLALGEMIDKKYLKKIDNEADAIDPHIWFDVQIWAEVVQVIQMTIAKQYPEEASFFQSNAEKYLAALNTLDQEVKAAMLEIPKPRRVLITAHDAFGYFGQAYEVDVKGLQGISTVSEFGLKDVAELVDFIVERRIKAVFVESSIPKKSLEAVVKGCQEKGQEVKIGGTLYSDALGASGTPEGTYIGMVRHNVATIRKSLK